MKKHEQMMSDTNQLLAHKSVHPDNRSSLLHTYSHAHTHTRIDRLLVLQLLHIGCMLALFFLCVTLISTKHYTPDNRLWRYQRRDTLEPWLVVMQFHHSGRNIILMIDVVRVSMSDWMLMPYQPAKNFALASPY